MDPVKAIAAITGRVLRHIADAIDNTDQPAATPPPPVVINLVVHEAQPTKRFGLRNTP